MKEVERLKAKAKILRQDIIRMISGSKSGHPAGALGMADIFAVLYFHLLKHNPKKPDWNDRDRLVLSNGHISAVRYSAMARSGYFSVKELKTFRKLNSRLQGHPSYKDLPGVESSSGSLGQGLSVAVGMALAAKLDKQNHRIYCIISDGELNEGSSWEAVNAANKWKLDNLIVIVDRNHIQISGNTEDIWPLEPLRKKFEAYNFHVVETNGNNIEKLLGAFERIKHYKGRPIVLIAKTIPGKGVSYMENDYTWHGKVLSDKEAEIALKELEK
ncbi:MAG: transketolase [archaeon]